MPDAQSFTFWILRQTFELFLTHLLTQQLVRLCYDWDDDKMLVCVQ